jgi:elongator complex protein 5
VQYEDLYVEGNDVKFDSAPASAEVNQSLVPKVSAYILDSRTIKYSRVPLMLVTILAHYTNICCKLCKLVQQVQFNLELSEKERTDRANVVLPFEHQGNL